MRLVKKWFFTPDAKRLPHRPPRFSKEDIEFNKKLLDKIFKVQKRPPKFADGYEYPSDENDYCVEIESESALREMECLIKIFQFRNDLQEFLEKTVKLKMMAEPEIQKEELSRATMIRIAKNKFLKER